MLYSFYSPSIFLPAYTTYEDVTYRVGRNVGT